MTNFSQTLYLTMTQGSGELCGPWASCTGILVCQVSSSDMRLTGTLNVCLNETSIKFEYGMFQYCIPLHFMRKNVD